MKIFENFFLKSNSRENWTLKHETRKDCQHQPKTLFAFCVIITNNCWQLDDVIVFLQCRLNRHNQNWLIMPQQGSSSRIKGWIYTQLETHALNMLFLRTKKTFEKTARNQHKQKIKNLIQRFIVVADVSFIGFSSRLTNPQLVKTLLR